MLRSTPATMNVTSMPAASPCKYRRSFSTPVASNNAFSRHPAASAHRPRPAHHRPSQTQHADGSASRSRPATVAFIIAASLFLPGVLDTAAIASVPKTTEAGANVGFLTDAEVDKKRKKANFRRAHDGHVAVMNKYTKQWTDVKCDLQVPGLLLLREADGQVFYLGYAGMKQVDLSDDEVVAAIAADTWEDNMRLVQAEAEDGTIEALEMTREGFYQLVSLVSGEDEQPPSATAAGSSKAGKAAAGAGKQR